MKIKLTSVILLISMICILTCSAEMSSLDSLSSESKSINGIVRTGLFDVSYNTIPSETSNQLKNEFKSFLESLVPGNTGISYPLFGLNVSNNGTLYEVYGNCKVSYPDKKKVKLNNAHALYWLDKSSYSFYRIAFYTKEDVLAVDLDLLPNIEEYLSNDTYECLRVASATKFDKIGVPIPKKITEEDKYQMMCDAPGMGYDFAFCEVLTPGRSWRYSFVDYDRNVITHIDVTASKASDRRSYSNLNTNSFKKSDKVGWYEKNDNGDNTYFYTLVDNTLTKYNVYNSKEVYKGTIKDASEYVHYVKSFINAHGGASSAFKYLNP